MTWDPEDMSARERAEEVAGLLADGYRRLLAARASEAGERPQKPEASRSSRLVCARSASD